MFGFSYLKLKLLNWNLSLLKVFFPLNPVILPYSVSVDLCFSSILLHKTFLVQQRSTLNLTVEPVRTDFALIDSDHITRAAAISIWRTRSYRQTPDEILKIKIKTNSKTILKLESLLNLFTSLLIWQACLSFPIFTKRLLDIYDKQRSTGSLIFEA